MLDTMTLTKIVGGFCGSLLVFLVGSWVAESLYHGGHGHGDDNASGYLIEVEVAEVEENEEDEELDFNALLAAADLGKGAKVFGKCKACHKLEDGANGTGPHLYKIIDRAVGAASGSGYGYSGALAQVADVWTTDELNGFLENPKTYAPGTKMGFAGLKKPEDRASVIAYLQSVN